MNVMKHNDEIIRSVKAFKHYNEFLSEVVSEQFNEVRSKHLTEPLYCGKFTAKIYIGQHIFGVYEFDCTHWRNFMELDVLVPKIKKIK